MSAHSAYRKTDERPESLGLSGSVTRPTFQIAMKLFNSIRVRILFVSVLLAVWILYQFIYWRRRDHIASELEKQGCGVFFAWTIDQGEESGLCDSRCFSRTRPSHSLTPRAIDLLTGAQNREPLIVVFDDVRPSQRDQALQAAALVEQLPGCSRVLLGHSGLVDPPVELIKEIKSALPSKVEVAVYEAWGWDPDKPNPPPGGFF